MLLLTGALFDFSIGTHLILKGEGATESAEPSDEERFEMSPFFFKPVLAVFCFDSIVSLFSERID
jgi:hypothetical protein